MTEFKKKQNGEIYDARNLELRSSKTEPKIWRGSLMIFRLKIWKEGFRQYQNYSEAVAKTSG